MQTSDQSARIENGQADKESMMDEKFPSTDVVSVVNLNDNGERDKLEAKSVTVASIIGEFGFYHLSLTVLAFVRYVCLAMMTNIGPLIAPEVEFWCQVNGDNSSSIISSLVKPDNITLDDYLRNRCQLEFKNGTKMDCSAWKFNTTLHGITITDTFDLVCNRDLLKSAFQSSVSLGVVLASIIWGSFSDRHGRLLTIKVCFICSLISGIISYLASDFFVYTISRSICSFSDLGLVVSLSTICVETLGNKYRGSACLIVYTGWAIGVMIMPWITEYFNDFRQLMLFTVVCHLLTLPWLMTIAESVRWLMVNGRFDQARHELERILSWDSGFSSGDDEKISSGLLDREFDKFREKFVTIASKTKLQREIEATKMSKFQLFILSIFGGLRNVNKLFQSRSLAITTIVIVWITFNSELLYMLFILISSDVGDSVKLNYAVGGAMEVLATIISMFIVEKMTRRLSLVTTLITISCLCCILAFTYHLDNISIWILNLTKLAISTLASLIFLTTTEVFPTNLRQTGFGFSGTIGSFGAVVAPFMREELANAIGMTSVLLIVLVLPLIAAATTQLFLRETKGVELPDDVDELEIENNFRERIPSITARPTTVIN